MKILFALLCLVLAGVSNAAAVKPPAFVPLAERTPAYFVDRYGPARSARNVSQHSFYNPRTGPQAVKGEFSVREFRTDGLRVRAVFHVPSLTLAEVRLQMERGQWTDEQVTAALAAYGEEWRLMGINVLQRHWATPGGTRAFLSPMLLHIQPPATVEALEKARLEAEAKRKAVPKF